MVFELWKRDQTKKYTLKSRFRNCVYKNRNLTLILFVKLKNNIHDFRMKPSMSISHRYFRFQQENSYTRFSNTASRVYSAVKCRYPEYSSSKTPCPNWSATMCRYPCFRMRKLPQRCLLCHHMQIFPTRRLYPIQVNFGNTGYVFCPESSTPTVNYPILRDFKNSGYGWSFFPGSPHAQLSSF